ncbi:stAR-related lipid transfer protein 13-like, partial [Limulus polyphemus]|uniref:StAR-related lipid transfer protein 13-like n=1 Tax=Limulus polyphemus TaxID=6850 RepID=A0ABM1TEU4_LIMPO
NELKTVELILVFFYFFPCLSELEAIEACNWLKAAGFPQYSQLYEDGLFPIDISSVQEDHKFLDPDSIQALFRRLNTLNKCAKMKVENLPRKSIQPLEESDEEQCALSENWQFQLTNRRWSRIPSPLEVSIAVNKHLNTSKDYIPDNQFTSSHDSVFVDDNQSSPDSLGGAFSANYEEQMTHNYLPVTMDEDHSTSGSGESTSCGSEKSSDLSENGIENFYRNGSERFKDSAKALLRRIESLKVKHKKKNQEAVVDGEQHISRGLASDSSPGSEGERSSASSLAPSPQMSCHKISQETSSDHSSLQDEESDGSQQSTPQLQHKTKWHTAQVNDLNAFSDSESSTPKLSRHLKDANSNIAEYGKKEQLSGPGNKVNNVFLGKDLSGIKENENCSYKNKKFHKSYLDNNSSNKPVKHLPTDISKQKRNEEQTKQVNSTSNPIIVLSRTSSVEQTTNRLNRIFTAPFLSQTNDDQTPPESNSVFYTSLTPDNFEMEVNSSQDETERSTRERRDSGVGSSLTRSSLYVQSSTSQIRWHWFPSIRRQSSVSIRTVTSHGLHISSLSASQLMKLRKLALLKLTSLMEKYNPTSRSGWNWGVPKFIRKIRTPDYKDKVVFGVPLLLILQRTGQPLPPSIQVAIRYLRKTALNAVGLFRKSGVRSRIQKLRNLNDSNPRNISYENQQAYDVADMLKQYFRELPDALLTNKLSETFISIFQYIPVENRKEAIQAAILLMPDENREVLQSLLAFLQEISQCSDENQMTATNLSVCFAPSLFHLTIPRSASASPRRRKVVGVPDQKELSENRAAHECLTYMINNYRQLFSVKEDNLRLANAEQLEPPTLEELGSLTNPRNYNWKTHVEMYLQGLQKEARDKFKSWLVVPHNDCVEVSYKKVDDGHPLRLWKVSVEIEAPPLEVLNRILRERNVWDDSLVKWRVVCRLDNQCEVFHHVCNSLGPHPPRDYCVLRSWRTDSPKGSCMLVETSIDHPDAPPLPGSVRGVVLASHFLVEPCGAGKSRLTHISRVDTRGRSPEWYNKAFGHICALQLICLRDSFKHGTEGPETKV